MSFLVPKTNLPDGLNDNTPGRTATQSPNSPLPLPIGPFKLAVQWVTPVLHWHYRTTKTSNYAFASIYGWIGLGPADQIRQIHVNRKPYQGVYVQRHEVGDAPYVKVLSKETPETFTFFWGTEAEGDKDAHLNALVRDATHAMHGATYPADRGIFSVSLRDVECGQVGPNGETPALPLVEIEGYRRSPKTYSFGHVDHGVNMAGAAWDLLTLKRGGGKLDPALLGDSWDTVITKLNTTGLAGISGTDLFGAMVLAERRELGEHLAEVLSYFDGFIVERNGKLELDYQAADDTTTDPTGLTVISEHEMDSDEDPTDEPDSTDEMVTMVNVTGLDLEADPPLQEATEGAPVPAVRRILQEDRPPHSVQRPGWVLRKQLKTAAQIIAGQKALPQWRGTVPILRQYAYHPDGVTPLRVGDRFDLDRADIGLDLVVRIVQREETDTHIVCKCVGERGAFPRPYEPEPDPRADLSAQPPADLVRFAAAQLPPDLSDAADTLVAMLAERASTATVGFDTHFSADDTWPGQVIDSGNIRWAVAATLQTGMAATYDAGTITVDEVGIDWPYLQSQSDLEQADDQLLMWRAGEWFSIGTITSLGGGSYSLHVRRARLGSLPVAHGIGTTVFIIPRNDLVSVTHASFAEVESGGSYDVPTATKYFKLRPYSSLQGNLTDSFSCVLRDPTPDQVTGLVVVMQQKLAKLSWTAVVGALVNEYQIYRSAWNGSSWDADVLAGETTSTDFWDVVPAFGVFRWRVRAMGTDETDGTYSDYVSGTASQVGSSDVDPNAPTTPSAPTFSSHGTYLSDDGGAFAWIQLSLPAMPSGGVRLLVLYRLNGSTSWTIADNRPTAGGTARIDDLLVGVGYQFACQALSNFGVPSGVSSVLSRTAPTDNTTPDPPSSGGVSSEKVVPSVFPGTGELQFGCRLYWDPTVPKDFSHWEVKVTAANDDASITYTWFSSGQSIPIRVDKPELLVYTNPPTPVSGHARVRTVDRSGNVSAWRYLGQCNTATTKGVGTIAEDERNDVLTTGIRTGGTGAPKAQVVKPFNTVINTGAGGAEVTVTLSISGAGFSWKPDKANIDVLSDGVHDVRYNWDHVDNSASTVYLVITRKNGAAVAAGADIRIGGDFIAGSSIQI
ncbi:hypothetical protein [Actomonas aquatica]|uniref:Tip attachment protein J domain-containing protein n=1 Tax=Actomonas aquatica TaxID=2866162 RepID=A0ABZ1CDC5_9BACT|nr:hypothetical protein [Opitutus sp. WL0086]WRQ89417.1 hypothetical protein K1X11_008345 [Opitutus sp. WL0086]